MGACIGKKSSKYSIRDHPKSDIVIQAPQPKTQDDILQNNSSPSPLEKSPVINDDAVNNDNDNRTSRLDENSIDSELQNILEQQERITRAFIQPFPSRFVSITDTELEFELTNLLYEFPKSDCTENTIGDTTLKLNDVQ